MSGVCEGEEGKTCTRLDNGRWIVSGVCEGDEGKEREGMGCCTIIQACVCVWLHKTGQAK